MKKICLSLALMVNSAMSSAADEGPTIEDIFWRTFKFVSVEEAADNAAKHISQRSGNYAAVYVRCGDTSGRALQEQLIKLVTNRDIIVVDSYDLLKSADGSRLALDKYVASKARPSWYVKNIAVKTFAALRGFYTPFKWNRPILIIKFHNLVDFYRTWRPYVETLYQDYAVVSLLPRKFLDVDELDLDLADSYGDPVETNQAWNHSFFLRRVIIFTDKVNNLNMELSS